MVLKALLKWNEVLLTGERSAAWARRSLHGNYLHQEGD
jgi:hypothetical protein